MENRILILDYGSQFTQLIARRIREERVYCEIHPPTVSVDWVREWAPKGIVLSGGPASVYDADVPTVEPELLAIGTTGAYGFSMASTYNARPRPAEVMVAGDQHRLVRRRETYEDLVRGEAELLE